mgnify:FL=1
MNNFNNLLDNDNNNNNNVFTPTSIQVYQFDEIINKTNILIDRTSTVIGKVDVTLEEWFKYQLLNKSSDIIYDLDKLILETSVIVNQGIETVDIYFNIGNYIFTNIPFAFHTVVISCMLGICIQTIMCILLYFLYKDNKNISKFINLKIESPNQKNNYLTYHV